MAIPYRTAKLKSSNNIFTMAILGPTAKFNFRQYVRLYSNIQTGIPNIFYPGILFENSQFFSERNNNAILSSTLCFKNR